MTAYSNFADLPHSHYGVILADPPWSFQNYSGKKTTPHRTVLDHYGVLSIESLKTLPVSEIAAKNSALIMWIVDSHLDVGIELGRAWGFTFKTRAFTWRKTTLDGSKARMGMGLWTRKESEIALLFTCGQVRRQSKGVREIIDAPRRENSRKPDEIYSRVEKLLAGPYLEMFGRQEWPGWDVFGNETDKFKAEVTRCGKSL